MQSSSASSATQQERAALAVASVAAANRGARAGDVSTTPSPSIVSRPAEAVEDSAAEHRMDLLDTSSAAPISRMQGTESRRFYHIGASPVVAAGGSAIDGSTIASTHSARPPDSSLTGQPAPSMFQRYALHSANQHLGALSSASARSSASTSSTRSADYPPTSMMNTPHVPPFTTTSSFSAFTPTATSSIGLGVGTQRVVRNTPVMPVEPATHGLQTAAPPVQQNACTRPAQASATTLPPAARAAVPSQPSSTLYSQRRVGQDEPSSTAQNNKRPREEKDSIDEDEDEDVPIMIDPSLPQLTSSIRRAPWIEDAEVTATSDGDEQDERERSRGEHKSEPTTLLRAALPHHISSVFGASSVGPVEGEEEEEGKEPPSVRRVQSQRTLVSALQPLHPRLQSFPSPPSAVSRPPRLSLPSTFHAASSAARQLSDMDFGGDATVTAANWDGAFLRAEHICDSTGKRPGDVGYNPWTLHVPDEVYARMTPAQQQYFDIKRRHWDVVLLMQNAQSYVMYDCDAEVGVRVLGLSETANQARPQARFPRAALDKNVARLVAAGYRVGRVDVIQQPEELEEDEVAAMGKQKHVVDRELCEIYTAGTLKDLSLIQSYAANYFLALTEYVLKSDERQEKKQAAERTALGGEIEARYGICYVEASIGAFTCGEFYDDATRTQLATILATLNPLEVAYPAHTLSDETLLVFCDELSTHAKEQPWVLARDRGSGWMTAEETWQWLDESGYFKRQRDEQGVALPFDQQEVEWPLALDQLMEQKANLAFEALGGCCHCLERVKTAEQLLTQRNFSVWTAKQAGRQADNMVMDNQTLSTLEILRARQHESNTEGGVKGSLLEYVDYCQSHAGHRLIRRWLSQPLANFKAIMDRQNAVSFLLAHRDIRSDMRKLLKQLPDLERQLSAIHSYSVRKPKEVPNSEQDVKMLKLFRSLVSGLHRAQEVRTRVFGGLTRADVASVELAGVTLQLPDYAGVLRRYQTYTNDWDAALISGEITPAPGVSHVYDDAAGKEQDVYHQLEQYLEQVRDKLECDEVQYKCIKKHRFTLQIPAGVRLSRCFERVSEDSYYTNRLTEELLPALVVAELDMETALREATRNMYAEFVSCSSTWKKVVSALATLDCLCSLADVSSWQQQHGYSIKPTVLEWQEDRGAVLHIKDSVHPVLLKVGLPGGKMFIPNDIVMGAADCPARFLLISGPNMGGKSTIMRQACVALILGQLGCEVPAQSATLTPVDRIFSRVGARDDIMRNKSTFYIECAEAVHILAHVSARSLVIMDELGRGTSMNDGAAIAIAVADELRKKGCLTLFSTHHQELIRRYTNQPGVAPYHMTSSSEDALPFSSSSLAPPTSTTATAYLSDVTFSYKFAAGVSSRSYGVNVARMAGIPEDVVREAAEVSAMLERRMSKSQKKRVEAGPSGAEEKKEGGTSSEQTKARAEAKAKVKAERREAIERTKKLWTPEETALLKKALMRLNIAAAYEAKMKSAGSAGPEQ